MARCSMAQFCLFSALGLLLTSPFCLSGLLVPQIDNLLVSSLTLFLEGHS